MLKRAIGVLVGVLMMTAGGPVNSEPVKIKYNGIDLAGEFVVAEDRTATDSVVLLLHGTLAHLDMETIKGLREVLTERGYNTLSVNLSFNQDNRTGMYDCATPHTHKYEDALDELTVWLDWLKGKGVKDVTLFGHSRGGGQAALFGATRGHDLLKRIVLMAPSTWRPYKIAEEFQVAHGRPLSEVLAQARAMVDAGKGADMMPAAGLLYCRGADVSAESFLSYYEVDFQFDTPALLSKIPQPILVVAAGQDTIVPDVIAKVRPQLDGDHLKLAVVDDADHFFLDLYAEDVADEVEDFLDPGS